MGPKLLGTFDNGRFEEYLDALPLKPEQMRDSLIFKQVAQKLARMHKLTNEFPLSPGKGADFWNLIYSLFDEAKEATKNIIQKFPSRTSPNFDFVEIQIKTFQQKTCELRFPIVFCHNDVL